MSRNSEPVAVITGASRGIGKATFELLRARGIRTFGLARNWKDTQSGAACDVSDESSVRRAFGWVEERFGRLDILVNCAGVATTTPPLESTGKEWEEILRTNVIGTYLCCKQAIPLMQKSGGGTIVNVSSVAGRSYSLTASVPYTSSKYAVIGITRQLAARFGKEGIRINCVCPSQTKTEMLLENIPQNRIRELESVHPLGRLAEPSEVAETIWFLSSAAASYMNGTVLDVSGGMV